VVLPSPCGPVRLVWSGAEIEAAKATELFPLDGKADGHWSSTSEEITMLGGVPGLNGSTGGAGSGGVDLSQLQQIEQQATQDMLAISQNQIQFNTQMNQAKAVHQAANSFQLNA